MQKEKITSQITANGNDLVLLKKHFPHCFDKNGDFDFDKFKNQLQSNKIDFSKESYSMDWLGKSYARLLASDPATTLLREDIEWNSKEENRTSENLLLKGDNLEVLKHLSNAYHEKIKMIYIDPPYNTGSDGFVYEDDRTFTVNEFSKLAGVDTEHAKKILSFVKAKSNSHSAWLTFMYPRLYIARQLLKDDGVIFVSIDDNEVAQLRILMDEIFGEENFITNYCWHNNVKGRQMDQFIKNTFENILVYSKNINNLKINNEVEKVDIKKLEYDKISFFKKDYPLHNGTADFHINNRPNLCYTIYYNDESKLVKVIDEKRIKDGTYFIGEVSEKGKSLLKDGYVRILPKYNDTYSNQRVWRWGQDKFLREYKTELIFEKENGGFYIYQKKRFEDGNHEKKQKNYINIDGGKDKTYLADLFEGVKVFESPKPRGLVKHIIKTNSNSTDLILDFFAGSGTTGDAVMQLNAEDRANGKEGDRKYILVQLPETIDPKTSKTAYDFVKNDLIVQHPTIFEITKERLIRAAKKIQVEAKDKEILKDIDFGFKIFETTPIWENYELEVDEFDPQATLFDESQLTDDDIQTLLTTWKSYDGIPLTQDLETIDLGGYIAHYGAHKLYLMDKGFGTKHLKKLIEKVDIDTDFSPSTIIAFGYHFESKVLREIAENTKNYSNKKHTDIDFVIRY
jgi:adenine-specific DNA-methyltransferase